jgi:hypothetical protein
MVFVFQSQTSFFCHLDSYPHSIAWEAALDNTLREAPYSRAFRALKNHKMRVKFIPSSVQSQARGYAQANHHRASRSIAQFLEVCKNPRDTRQPSPLCYVCITGAEITDGQVERVKPKFAARIVRPLPATDSGSPGGAAYPAQALA